MGLFRKAMSVTSLGMVSYRSKSEKNLRAVKQTAKYSKQARNAARVNVAQNAFDLELQREQLEYAQQQAGIAQAQLEEQVRLREEQELLQLQWRQEQLEQHAQQQANILRVQLEEQMSTREEQELRQRALLFTQPQAGPDPAPITSAVVPTPPPSKPAGWYPMDGDPGAVVWWDGLEYHSSTLHYKELPLH